RACVYATHMLFEQFMFRRQHRIYQGAREMPTQILPAASLRSACRLPAARAPVRSATYLICAALRAIGSTIVWLVANFCLVSGTSKWPTSELKIALIRAPNGLTLLNATAFIRSSASQPK